MMLWIGYDMVAATLQRCTADSSPSLHISSDLALAAVVTRKEKKKNFFRNLPFPFPFPPPPHPTSQPCAAKVCGGEDENRKKKKHTISEKENLLPPLLETKMRQDQAAACGPLRKARNKITPLQLFLPFDEQVPLVDVSDLWSRRLLLSGYVARILCRTRDLCLGARGVWTRQLPDDQKRNPRKKERKKGKKKKEEKKKQQSV